MTQLLRDSNLVASYGMRAGLFGQGATLFEAIRAASAKGEKLDPTSPETVELEKELGTAIKVIYPVSLPDLQADGVPMANPPLAIHFGSMSPSLSPAA